MEREHTSEVAVADAEGRLRPEAVGWARHASLMPCALSPHLSRVHAWNYWCISSRTSALTLLLADVQFAGVALVSFQDFAAARPVERVHIRPLGLATRLPDSPRGDVAIDARRLHLTMRARGDDLEIEVDARTLLGARIEATLSVKRPEGHETVNVLVPWDETRFQFTSKQQALAASGVVRVDGREHRFGPENDGFACLDYGRGRWPPRIEWQWAFGARRQGGSALGFNLGGTWTDGTGVTENGLVLDGRVHKIASPVRFERDPRDLMRPWRILSGDQRVDLRFTPHRRRDVVVPLGIAGVELHQMMGTFAGTFIDDGGARVLVEDTVGLAESLRARWDGRLR